MKNDQESQVPWNPFPTCQLTTSALTAVTEMLQVLLLQQYQLVNCLFFSVSICITVQ
jgi:hypothetical protein